MDGKATLSILKIAIHKTSQWHCAFLGGTERQSQYQREKIRGSSLTCVEPYAHSALSDKGCALLTGFIDSLHKQFVSYYISPRIHSHVVRNIMTINQ